MTFLLSWQEPLPIAKFSTKDREHNRGLQQEVLIFRYLFKEIFITLVALTTILLFIFMSNQFVQYLNRAVGGQIPAVMLMKLMMLELPTLMGLLLPLGFYVAILVAYGRLYADSEMTVLQACGYGPTQLFWHTLTMAILVAGLVAKSLCCRGSRKNTASDRCSNAHPNDYPRSIPICFFWSSSILR